jgi:hypothetical protein
MIVEDERTKMAHATRVRQQWVKKWVRKNKMIDSQRIGKRF